MLCIDSAVNASIANRHDTYTMQEVVQMFHARVCLASPGLCLDFVLLYCRRTLNFISSAE